MAARLPYVDNARAVLITLVVNVGAAFAFNWPGGVTYGDVVWDSLFCAAVTIAVDMWIVYAGLKKMRASGAMPLDAPTNGFMQKLPQNPFALGVLYALTFGVVTAGINAVILRFFGIQSMSFAPWVVYKLIYATVLSVKVTEWCIFRYVQPDWAHAEGTAAEKVDADIQAAPAQAVRNPWPEISMFKAMYASVTGNIALNILIGSALGGVAVGADRAVIIRPTTVEGIPITGLVFGLIAGILVTNGFVKEMNAAILASRPTVPETMIADKRFAWMPVRRGSLICLISVCLMVFSTLTLPSVMRLFGLSVMNFYQYTVFMTVYATLISKPLAYMLVQRCTQPDYIRYTLKKHNERY